MLIVIFSCYSTDSGWDNPFRPDGDLSREADEIVELIKGGKPITPTPGGLNLSGGGAAVPVSSAETAATVTTTATAASPANGSGPTKPAGPGAVELQRATVAPGDASQVEHVVLKKKPKCKCCVIQ